MDAQRRSHSLLRSRPGPGAIVTFLAVAVAGVVWFSASFRAAGAPADLPVFWAAAGVFCEGGDPYDVGQRLAYAASRGATISNEPIYNAPMFFSYIGWWCLLSLPLTVEAWRLLTIGLFIAAALIVLRQTSEGRGSVRQAVWQGALLASFAPVPFHLTIGHIIPVMTLAYAAYWSALANGAVYLAGAALAVTVVKPHLLYLVYPAAVFELWKRRRTAPFIAGAFVVGVLCSAPLLVSPALYNYYGAVTSQGALTWQQPNLGAWLQAAVGPTIGWVRFVPAVLTLAVALPLLARGVLPACPSLLLPLSMLTTPYCWLHDFALLLPAVIIQFERVYPAMRNGSLAGTAIVSVIIGANLLLFTGPDEMQYYVWYPLLLTVTGFAAMRFTTPGRCVSAEAPGPSQ